MWFEWSGHTGVIQYSNSQVCSGICRAWDLKNLVKTDCQNLILDSFKHDILVAFSGSLRNLDPKDMQSCETVVQSIIEASLYPVYP